MRSGVLAVHVRRVVVLAMVFSWNSCGEITGPDLFGEWGGDHVSAQLSITGGVFEYDCAHGTIDEVIQPDPDGSFVVHGVHVREHGGPIQQGEQPDAHPALYVGWTDGSNMIMEITLLDTQSSVGRYELKRGHAGRVFRCL